MEVVEVLGYVTEEKIAVAERYLGPQAGEASGLGKDDLQLEREGVTEMLIKYYCRESGVRNLKKHIDKVCALCSLIILIPKPCS